MKNDAEWVLDIYSINDFHGVIEDVIWETSSEEAHKNQGVLMYSELINCINKSENTLVLSAGDMFESPSFGMEVPGLLTVELLNLVKCKAMAIGNHEFDWIPHDEDFFINLKKRLDCKFLSANLIDKRTGINPKSIEKSIIVKVKDTHIGIIGLTTRSCKSICLENEFKNYDVTNAIVSLEKEIQSLKKQGINIIILLAHCDASRSKEDTSLKGELVDILKHFDSTMLQGAIAAHGHELTAGTVNGIPVVQAGSYGNGLGKIEVSIKNDKVVDLKAEYIDIEKDSMKIHEKIKGILIEHRNKYKRTAKKIGFSQICLKVESESESFWGEYIAKVMAYSVSASIGMINVGAIRTTIIKGDILDIHIKMNLPFENKIISMELLGEKIVDILKQSYEKGYGIMQTYGISSDKTFDKNGIHISNLRDHKGKLIKLNEYYSVAVTDFMLESIDFKDEFINAVSIIDSNILIRDAVLEYINKNKYIV
ncbi:metallophosphoesterase [Alkaliphilus metalliredigens QYMF]|uniref:Metallophosphoesterase n=1 Tax=Alkaliphilus metalliredigens (strain QYMF) TaxID=293826 RepID=A6TNZ0_ALKMQ|nr:5'-nucleotidase C-terminal domain-containing protein [Alkaliphilus metalliredigens]ABR47908.1 metallophosphoesterase [Alkaliphilus metalliredigens QYMF]